MQIPFRTLFAFLLLPGALRMPLPAAPLPTPQPLLNHPILSAPFRFTPAERFEAVSILIPPDPDGYLLENLPPFELEPLELVRKQKESLENRGRVAGAQWMAIAGNLLLWEDYAQALDALYQDQPEPEYLKSQQVVEAWLLERIGDLEGARRVYLTLAKRAEERRKVYRQLIALELRHQRFQAAMDWVKTLETLETETTSASSLYIKGLVAFAVADDFAAWQYWIELSRRPPAERTARGFLGLALLSLQNGELDAALGWWSRAIVLVSPAQQRDWWGLAVAERLTEHPDTAELKARTMPAPPESAYDRVRDGELHTRYLVHFEEITSVQTSLRLQIHEENTPYRTLNLQDVAP